MSVRNEQCKKVCRILDDVLANRPSERDALIVAVQKAFDTLAEYGWIPCSEHLPKKFSYYLVTLNNSTVDFCIWNENEFGMFSPKWCPCNEVTAWRELPKPYQPKEDKP